MVVGSRSVCPGGVCWTPSTTYKTYKLITRVPYFFYSELTFDKRMTHLQLCFNLMFFYPQRIPTIMQAFNDNNVSFVVRGGRQVLVMLADPNAGTVHLNAICM